MLNALFRSTQEIIGSPPDKDKTQANQTKTTPALRPARVLVIQADKYDWSKIMAPTRLTDGRKVVVEQVGWDEITVCGYSHSAEGSLIVNIHRVPGRLEKRGGGKKGETVAMFKTFLPDVVLVRNEVYTCEDDFRSQLYGLMYSGVPCINSLSSIYSFCERPIIYGELIKIAKRLGKEAFPLIEQNYFSNHRGFMYCLPFPAVVKVGHAHAGAGKMKVANHKEMEDFRSVLQMTNTYCTGEQYFEGEYDLRIQKIGADNYRAYKRVSLSGTWKTNTQSSHVEEVELTETYKRWVDEASTMLGGLDILTVDAIHTPDGKEYILEANGTSSGLCPQHEQEDNEHIRDLVVAKLEQVFCSPEEQTAESKEQKSKE